MADMAAVLQAMAADKAARAAGRQAKAKRPHVAKSTCADPCAVVWRIAGSMWGADPATKRDAVHVACEEAGVATDTARTQVQAFLAAAKAHGFRRG